MIEEAKDKSQADSPDAVKETDRNWDQVTDQAEDETIVAETEEEDNDKEEIEEEEGTTLSTEEIKEIMDEWLDKERSNERDTELLCGATLLAEHYEKSEDYQDVNKMGRLAQRVIEEFYDSHPDEEAIKVIDGVVLEALPRLISAVEGTVYNHLLRDLIAILLVTARRNHKNMDDYRRDAEKLVKLDILLEHDPFDRQHPDKELKAFLAEMFTSEQLIDFITNPTISHLRCDPVEYTWKWEEIYYDVEAELNRRFKNTKRHMGFCFRYWSEKQNLLKKKYGIEWHSPSQMNPRVMFD